MRWLSPGGAENENGRTVTFRMETQRTIMTQIFSVIMCDISLA
jgi:hypothetical protein